MLRFTILTCELLIVVIAIFLADTLQSRIDFIPRALIHLPEVDYTDTDFWVVFRFFLIVHAVIFVFMQWRVGRWIPADGRRTAAELFGLAAAFAISALAVFVTTSVSFDPNFMVGIILINAAIFILVYLFSSLAYGSGVLETISTLAVALLRRAFSVAGILTLVIAISPAVLAKLFVSNRDVANVVTQIRIYFSQEDTGDYALVNALAGRKFLQPMQVKTLPGSPDRLIVLERAGRLLAVDYPSGKNEMVVLDIRDLVGPAEIENGALGFAFHPEFGSDDSPNSSYFYVYYTSVKGDAQINRLSRFSWSSAGVEVESEQPLLILPRNNEGFHNGGSVEFGPDGFLYVALGEGVHPKGIVSLNESLRGGIIRIDVDKSGGDISHPIERQPEQGMTDNYFIPNDNPFIGKSILEEYWAIGLRNPFRMQFDRATGLLWVGDVGSTKWEEINLVEKGMDYQFPAIEGFEKTGKSKLHALDIPERGPIYTYVHTAYDRAVIGGFIYRGQEFDELVDKYLFADNYSSKLFAMRGDGTVIDEVEHLTTADQFAQRGTSSLTQLTAGHVLLTTLGRSGVATGEVLRLIAGGEALGFSQQNADQVEEVAYSDEEIRKIFIENCARCHGADGSGRGPDSIALGVPLPDFSSARYQAARTDQYILDVINKGGHALGLSPLMPAWQHLLSDEESAALVIYMRNLEVEED